ncbi:hypothetical protein [Demequina litorisediminis]|nr:hypothetical protein [Demequina litorisediminis]
MVWARRDPGRDEWAGEDDEWQFDTDGDMKQQRATTSTRQWTR